MWDSIVDVISWGLIISGAFFMISGSLGILRMPDFFTRLHPAGITDSFGAPLILLGVAVHFGVSLVSGKIILLIILLLVANPTATHVLSQSALVTKLKPYVKGKK